MSRSVITYLALGVSVAGAPVFAQAHANQDEPVTTSICTVQGAGSRSPHVNQKVQVDGTVTAVIVRRSATGVSAGFFLQAPDCDDDAATSDAIWVFDPERIAEARVGTSLRVTGTVGEFFGLTELRLEDAEPLPDSAPVTPLPLEEIASAPDPAALLESREGMLVVFPPSVVVAATNGFGDAYLIPADSGREHLFEDVPDRIGIFQPGGWLAVDTGDRLGPTTAVLTFDYGNWKLALSDGRFPEISPTDRRPQPRPISPPETLTVATYNLKNLFDAIDDEGVNDDDWTPTPEQYAAAIDLRARSIAERLGYTELLAVQEVENLSVLDDLAAHPALAGFNYSAVLQEGLDDRGIDVGLLYDRDVVEILEVTQLQACAPTDIASTRVACLSQDGEPGSALYARPPLQVRLHHAPTGRELILINNHFRSKSGGEAATTPTRIAMAEHLVDVRRQLAATHPSLPVIVLGDLNDTPTSDPLDRLTAPGEYVNLTARVPPEDRYTYIFNGISQVLDYILIGRSPPPAPSSSGKQWRTEVVGVEIAHINVDFAAPNPNLPAAMSGPGRTLYHKGSKSAAHRASDHDPVVATLGFRDEFVMSRVYLPSLRSGGGPRPQPTATVWRGPSSRRSSADY